MRVAFDTRPCSDPHGLGRYSRCLLDALRATAGPEDEVLELRRPALIARSRGADVYHSPWIEGALLRSSCPMIVTVRSLAALKRRSERLRAGMGPRLRNLAVQRAAYVIVPTRAVAEDVVGHLGVERERIIAVAEAADPTMSPRPAAEVAAVRRRHGLPERYLLWVGGLEHPDPARHVAELAAAPRELPLVLVGRTRPWAHELAGEGLADVILTGRVPDEELSAIYSGAHALMLACEHEGFGLPAVEALTCGAPVAAFDSPGLREALGDRALFVPPGDVHGLIAAAQDARRPAPAPPAWSWRDAASASWEIYRRALAPTAREPTPARRRPGPRAARIDRLEPQ